MSTLTFICNMTSAVTPALMAATVPTPGTAPINPVLPPATPERRACPRTIVLAALQGQFAGPGGLGPKLIPR